MKNNSTEELIERCRLLVSYGDVATMPTPLYEEIKAQLQRYQEMEKRVDDVEGMSIEIRNVNLYGKCDAHEYIEGCKR